MSAMIAPRRRGVCPSLSEPMQTGDGLLARVNPVGGSIRPQDLAALARAAARFGNGILEVTLRGSLQIRGLRDDTVAGMNAAVEQLGVAIRTGLPVDVAPLAGLCLEERADPRPLARAIEAIAKGLATQLGPKVSVVIDGGGPSMLDAVLADVRLTAVDDRIWQLALAGDAGSATPIALHDRESAVAAAIARLRDIAQRGSHARGRDLLREGIASQAGSAIRQAGSTLRPGDMLSLLDGRCAAVVALPFGAATADTLATLGTEMHRLGIDELRLSPGRMLILLAADENTAQRALGHAAAFDVIVRPNDPRLRIVACAGAPACGSGFYNTRQLGHQLSAEHPEWLDDRFLLHLSGCEKQCAKPGGAHVDVIGMPGTRKIVANGIVLPAELRDRLTQNTPMQRAS